MTKSREKQCRFIKIALYFIISIILMEMAWPAYYIVPRMLYSQKLEQVVEVISKWSNADTKLASEWEALGNGVVNVCYCSDVVSYQELNKLLVELKRLDQQPRDRSTVDFLWNRLAETGSHGKAVVTRFRNYRNVLDGNSLFHVGR